MNFHSCKKQIFKSFVCNKTVNDSQWTKTSRNEVMQPTTNNNDSRPIIPYHVHIQAGFDKSLYTSAFRRWVWLFNVFQGNVSIRAAIKANSGYTLIIVGSWKSRFKTLNLNVSDQEGCSPQTKIGSHLLATTSIGIVEITPTLEHAWATPRHAVIGGS